MSLRADHFAGYRARSYIAKNLQRRCQAIREAVKEFNSAAQALDPNAEPLDWSRVSHYNFVQEFELLKDSHSDIREKPWACADIREAIHQWRRIRGAEDEVTRLNVEVPRLHTWIRDEESLFRRVLGGLRERRDRIFGAAEEYCRRRRGANARNLAYILHLHQDKGGYTGPREPGTAVNPVAPPDLGLVVPDIPQDESEAVAKEISEKPELEGNDQANEEVAGVLEFLAGLSV